MRSVSRCEGFFLLTITLSMLFPFTTLAIGEKGVKAGFIRDGNLWVLINNEKKTNYEYR